jgi:tetratricopeptide (TPR) repeat protein
LYLGLVQIHTNRAAQGIAECERALALDQNLAGAHAAVGIAKCFIGLAEETQAHITEALRLSPRDTNAHAWLTVVAFAKLLLSEYDEAATMSHRALEINSNYPQAHLWLAAALAHLGRDNEARAAANAALALNPTFTISRIRASSDDPTYLAQRERIRDGMRKAGVPEG